MVTLHALWLPILLAAVFVFIAANLLWMALPFWHRKDYGKLAQEEKVLDALTDARSGQYVVPCVDWAKLDPQEREAAMARPMGFLILRNPGRFSFPAALLKFFVYVLVMVILVAYLTGRTVPAGVHYLRVFRVAGTAGMLAFSFGSVTDSIWYGKPWSVNFKQILDGLLYGLLIGGTFGWLWPH